MAACRCGVGNSELLADPDYIALLCVSSWSDRCGIYQLMTRVSCRRTWQVRAK